MKSAMIFIRATLTGGILFLIPVVLTLVILNKARVMILKLSAPLTRKMPDIILGLDGSNLLAIVMIILFCFVAGLIFRSDAVRSRIEKWEDNFLSYMPGYTMIKSIASDIAGDSHDHNMKTVLVKGEEGWNLGFLVEKDEKHCAVFLPEAPRHDSGEIKIVKSELVKIIEVPTNKAARSIQRYGRGSLEWARRHSAE